MSGGDLSSILCGRGISLRPSVNPPRFPSLSWTLQGVWTEPAHPLTNVLMQFIQSNIGLIKFTLLFNVGAYDQVQKPACMQSSATVGRTDTMDWITGHVVSARHLKLGIRAHLDPHTDRK